MASGFQGEIRETRDGGRKELILGIPAAFAAGSYSNNILGPLGLEDPRTRGNHVEGVLRDRAALRGLQALVANQLMTFSSYFWLLELGELIPQYHLCFLQHLILAAIL